MVNVACMYVHTSAVCDLTGPEAQSLQDAPNALPSQVEFGGHDAYHAAVHFEHMYPLITSFANRQTLLSYHTSQRISEYSAFRTKYHQQRCRLPMLQRSDIGAKAISRPPAAEQDPCLCGKARRFSSAQ